MPEVSLWWDVAQKVGSGAAFVMGIALTFLWRAYTSELKYSKERDQQTLTVLLNLTKIVESLEDRDKEFSARHETTTATLLNAINGLRDLINSHYTESIRRELK